MPTILGCWLNSPASAAARCPRRSGRAPAAGMPNSSAWFTAAGWADSSLQWAAASQPAASRAEPAANATATRASLFRGGRGSGSDVQYGATVMGGAGEDRGGFRCLAAVLDTIGFPLGAAGALNFHPAAGPVGTPRQRRAVLRGLTATGSR